MDILHQNPWFSVKHQDGYYTVESAHPLVMVLPVVGQEAILLARVKRPVLRDVTWELPGGHAEPGETPLEAVRRELREETGIMIEDLDRFMALPPLSHSPARDPQRLHVFRVEVTAQEVAQRQAHDHEVEGVEVFPIAEVKKMIADGRIYVNGTIALIAVYLFSSGSDL